MSLLKQKKDYMTRGKFDELYTPLEAVKMIVDYIPKHIKIIWEPTAIKESKIVYLLESLGYTVITSHIKDGKDFLEYEPLEYDMMITNPPYSLKDKFLERAFNLGKPFMMLLPITTLEGKKRGDMFIDNKIQLLIPNKRFNFKPDKKGAWFQTSWFCFNIGLDQDINFIKI